MIKVVRLLLLIRIQIYILVKLTSPPRNGLIIIHIHLPVDVANVLQILK
jgi:hypothetical protein